MAKKTRNRAAQDATLINLRALQKTVLALTVLVHAVIDRVKKLEGGKRR